MLAARTCPTVIATILVVASMTAPSGVAAQLPTRPPAEMTRWSVHVHHHLNWGGPGTRAGDIQGYGLAVERDLAGRWTRWSAQVGVDRLEYDLETPVHATGVEPRRADPRVDALTTATRYEVAFDYCLRGVNSSWQPRVGGGVGLYMISAPEVTGNTEQGGTFRIRTDTPTTLGGGIWIGSDWRLGRAASAGVAVSYRQTASRYRVTELVTGRTGTIRPFAPLGLTTRLSYRF